MGVFLSSQEDTYPNKCLNAIMRKYLFARMPDKADLIVLVAWAFIFFTVTVVDKISVSAYSTIQQAIYSYL